MIEDLVIAFTACLNQDFLAKKGSLYIVLIQYSMFKSNILINLWLCLEILLAVPVAC